MLFAVSVNGDAAILRLETRGDRGSRRRGVGDEGRGIDAHGAHLAANGEAKLQELLAATPRTGPVVETAVLFGRPGFVIREYAEKCRADLLVINSPDGRYRLMDRIFTHDLEYILEHLPCNMLIVHSRLAEGS